MKKLFLLAAVALSSLFASAQDAPAAKNDSTFEFTTIKENPITSIKNQNRSGTCWAFSSFGFFESELLRMGKGEFNLSEMFLVHHTMIDRAINYTRLHGSSSFAPGGSFYDAVYCLKHYGLVPQEAMPGIMYGDSLPNHKELDMVAKAYVNAIAKSGLKKLSNVWKKGVSAIYDTYLGQCPETFTYKEKEYTPKSFAEMLDLDADDYVSLTSYTHQPFYTQFPIMVEDNWRNGMSWNLPLNELMEVMDNAIKEGYTFAWGADVSEDGFTRNGIAVVPDSKKAAELSGSDMAHWLGMSRYEKRSKMTNKPLPELKITQEMRQEGYNNWQTTDDHGMQIYGIAKDQNGKEYYMMKNSWGFSGKYKGLWYVSKAFAAYKTMNILIHKDAVPKKIAKKLGLR